MRHHLSSSSSSSSRMTSSAIRASDEAYAEAMHAILSGEPCRGLVTEPTRLLPHVYIGSQSNAEDLRTMRRLGVTHVLNCAGYKGPRPSPNASPYDGLGIDYYEFKVRRRSLRCIRAFFTTARVTTLSNSVLGVADRTLAIHSECSLPTTALSMTICTSSLTLCFFVFCIGRHTSHCTLFGLLITS